MSGPQMMENVVGSFIESFREFVLPLSSGYRDQTVPKMSTFSVLMKLMCQWRAKTRPQRST